jgi:hypothetical protein
MAALNLFVDQCLLLHSLDCSLGDFPNYDLLPKRIGRSELLQLGGSRMKEVKPTSISKSRFSCRGFHPSAFSGYSTVATSAFDSKMLLVLAPA